ncbi:MAG: HRDC domain-containing protein, partial [Anaerolineae bacterium]|nr:HRDC domain-containing protein [Anaerolineae bacterium]
SPPADAEGYDPDLYQQLRAWRRETATQSGQKAFHVFSDATLQSIAAAQPTTLDELAAVKGVGPKKLEQYGQAVTDIIQAFPTSEGGES